MSTEILDFEHRLVYAATAPRVQTTGISSPFALGQQIASQTEAVKPIGSPRKGADGGKPTPAMPRVGSQQHRLLMTLESCGPMNTDGIGEVMGINLKQAADMVGSLVRRNLVSKIDVEGRKTYAILKRKGGFYKWLEKKTQTTGASADVQTQPSKPPRKASSQATVSESKSNDVQHGGTHYKVLPIEPWDYIAANSIGFLEGNAIKYLSRWRIKGGLEDLRKAQHYVEKLIELAGASQGEKA